MAVPRHPHTRSKVHKRRMHIFLTHPVLTVCPKCKKPIRPHTACANCGYYKGREVLNMAHKLTKKEQKAKEKEEAKKEKAEKKEKPAG